MACSKVQGPKPLVQFDNDKPILNDDALRELTDLQRLTVVGIVGLCRSGKSYLISRIGGHKKDSGFKVGHTMSAETKGIWMSIVSHPQRPDETLILLDSEGLEDTEKEDSETDCKLFILMVLLSSVLIYNIEKSMKKTYLETLGLVTDLSDRIQVKDDKIESVCPTFILLIRDALKHKGTADEYFESILTEKMEPESRLNKTKKQIKTLFPKRKCFMMPKPGPDSCKLEDVDNHQLDSEFTSVEKDLKNYIFEPHQRKKMKNGEYVNGTMFCELIKQCVQAMQKKGRICMDRVSEAMHNKAIMYDVIINYKQTMNSVTGTNFTTIHRQAKCDAYEYMKRNLIGDSQQQYIDEFERTAAKMERQFEEACKGNEKRGRSLSEIVLSIVADSFTIVKNITGTTAGLAAMGAELAATGTTEMLRQSVSDGTLSTAMNNHSRQSTTFVNEAIRAAPSFTPADIIQPLTMLKCQPLLSETLLKK